MLTVTTPQLRDIVKKAHPGDAVVAAQVDAIDFQEFSQLEERVKTDVEFLQQNALVLKDTKITGWVYSVENGKVNGLCMKNVSNTHGWRQSDNANCVVYSIVKTSGIKPDIPSSTYYDALGIVYSFHSFVIYASVVCFRITGNAEDQICTYMHSFL
jgi:hypothetical protein